MALNDHFDALVLSLGLLLSALVGLVSALVGIVLSSFAPRTTLINFSSILITGASAGIGKALAVAYAQDGRTLFLTGRNRERLIETQRECEAKGAQVEITTIDVSDEQAFSKWVEEADKRKPIDLLIANAGTSGSILGTSRTADLKIREMFAINVDGVLNTLLPVFTNMRDRRRGHIVVVSSLSGLFDVPTSVGYSATKAAVFQFTTFLREVMRPHNVRVSVVCPGYVDSNMTRARRSLGSKMPFFMSTDAAIKIITQGIDENRGVIAFPLPMYLIAWFFRSLPPSVSDFIFKLINPTKKLESWNSLS
ncbi:short-chain dehydrogenase/reductase SDR [Capsaspora owczarzaki ATCC 30864]|uniref:Short-chain dehydrogenase/reductase SDR n=1 Tax=Capsaspora owczarzaki (strain ATCC 30864) TaxID=595528 RepID=A0A0D2WL07_CAPO3|nr:short-chain dehydrogenase/reductase SDR [Capsaspora owczarzaki ATCC 30864]KJE90448.1 short-chain dehydrogenase/reductase SDR [Capsaspora owczarzaki ATCC 30864]|eukprot:XP_004364628.1 short-chain dehydrogenase/reductase SDR [Capsaspora owczarzaki ATCC 30864]